MNYSESNPDKLDLSHLYQGKAVTLKLRVIMSTTYQLRRRKTTQNLTTMKRHLLTPSQLFRSMFQYHRHGMPSRWIQEHRQECNHRVGAKATWIDRRHGRVRSSTSRG